MLPYYVRIIDFLKQHGIQNIHVDSDGYIEKLIPLWNEVGVTGIFPFEVQAGNNPVNIRDRFPNLQMLGGIDKRILIIYYLNSLGTKKLGAFECQQEDIILAYI